MALIDLLYILHERTYRVNFTNEKWNAVWILGNICAKSLAFIIRIFIPFIRIPRAPLLQGNNIIVSIASYPQRFPFLRYTLVSILRQSLRPEKIIVNLTKEECPNLDSDLPLYLRGLEKFGVEYVFLEDNLRPHKKYIYTLHTYVNKLIVTVDDDVFYPNNIIKKLFDLHKKNPTCVCANRVRRIILDEDGNYMPYSTWPLNNSNVKGDDYLAIGVGGVLYPAYLFKDSDVFNRDKIRLLSLNADDLWLKAHEILLGIPVVTGNFEVFNVDVSADYKKVGTLSASNVKEGKNDIQWKNLDKEYSLRTKIFGDKMFF